MRLALLLISSLVSGALSCAGQEAGEIVCLQRTLSRPRERIVAAVAFARVAVIGLARENEGRVWEFIAGGQE